VSVFAGLVLAGGQSIRMGQDKAELVIAGQTYLARARSLLLKTGASEILVSRNNTQSDMQDMYPNAGPLAGIYTAMQHTELNLLIIPIDMPLLNKDLLLNLIRTEAQAAYYRNHPMPLFLKNSPHVAAYLQTTLDKADADKSIKGLLGAAKAQLLSTDAQDRLININTLAQLESLNKSQ
jgi:molybdopterin-guanine dinucleotide biosynthesis protein A